MLNPINVCSMMRPDDKMKEKYSILFEQYFLKSFSSRLAEYTNPEIDVFDKEVLNENQSLCNLKLNYALKNRK